MVKMDELTPIVKNGDIYFKRDDFYTPFTGSSLNGGKCRQALSLIHNNSDLILDKFQNTTISAVSVDSPQGMINAQVCKDYGIKCILIVGSKSSVDKICKDHNLMNEARKLGAEIIAYKDSSNYQADLDRKINKDYGDKFFVIKFGFGMNSHTVTNDFWESSPLHSASYDSILQETANQVENLPDDIQHLVIPAGSGISASGIMQGLNQFNKKPKIIHIVQIDEKTRQIKGDLYNVNYVEYGKFPYSVKHKIPNMDFLDWVYEAKAYHWLMNESNIDFRYEKTVFWVVANMNDFH